MIDKILGLKRILWNSLNKQKLGGPVVRGLFHRKMRYRNKYEEVNYLNINGMGSLKQSTRVIRSNPFYDEKNWWRYQPVYTEELGEKCYFLIEVYFSQIGNNTPKVSWTGERVYPISSDICEEPAIDDLAGTLEKMLYAVKTWKPVDFSQLSADTTFEKL